MQLINIQTSNDLIYDNNYLYDCDDSNVLLSCCHIQCKVFVHVSHLCKYMTIHLGCGGTGTRNLIFSEGLQ